MGSTPSNVSSARLMYGENPYPHIIKRQFLWKIKEVKNEFKQKQ